MIWNNLSIIVILLSLIPGALCKYDYNIGGLVAAGVVSLFMLILIAIMLIVIVLWRDWYERKQMMRGIPKRPRRYWGLFPGRSKSPSVLLSTPRSDRKHHYTRNLNAVHHGSRSTTLTRADEWLTKLPPAPQEVMPPRYRYEEKVQTMTFEPEEDHVIVADILPENDTRQVLKHTTDYENAPPRMESERQVEFRKDGEYDYYIPYEGPKSDYRPRQQLRHTLATTPYHVKMSQLQDEPVNPSNDIFIAPPQTTTFENEPMVTITNPVNVQPIVIHDEPPVPEPSVEAIVIKADSPVPGPSSFVPDSPRIIVNEDGDKVAVMTFADSDEEAGMIPNTQATAENDVLF